MSTVESPNTRTDGNFGAGFVASPVLELEMCTRRRIRKSVVGAIFVSCFRNIYILDL